MLRIKIAFIFVVTTLSVLNCVSLPDETSRPLDTESLPNTPTPDRDIVATLEALDQLILAARMTSTAPPTSTPVPAPTSTPVPAPTATPVPAPTATPVPAPTATPAPVPTATPVPAPTATPAPVPTSTPVPVPTATPVAIADPTCTNRYSSTVPTIYLSSTTKCITNSVTITWDVEKVTKTSWGQDVTSYYINYTLDNNSPYDYPNGHVKFRIWNTTKTKYADVYYRQQPVHQSTTDEEGLSDYREIIPNTITSVGEVQLTRFDAGDY